MDSPDAASRFVRNDFRDAVSEIACFGYSGWKRRIVPRLTGHACRSVITWRLGARS